jgi:DNA-binding CsgD family transcriptional regulator
MLFRDAHQRDLMRWALAARLLAVAQQGDAAAADTAAAEMDAIESGALAFLGADLDRARAWHAVVKGDLASARGVLVDAAERALAVGAVSHAFLIANELVRLGRADAAARVVAGITVESGWPLGAAVHGHIEATIAGDAVALEAAAHVYAGLEMDLFAAEAAATAAALWRSQGSARTARRVAAWSEELAGRCEGAQTPALARAGDAGVLSPREQEVALLAVQGRTNRSIAEQLALSERTVENHLQRVYTKLGISARDELAKAMGTGRSQE